MREDRILRFPSRTLTNRYDEALPRLTEGESATQIARIMNGVAETLAKSCLYFSPENLHLLGMVPDVSAMLERLDLLNRVAIADGALHPDERTDFRAFVECVGNLRAGAEAAHLAAQIFLILRRSRVPISFLTPLKKVADSALRTLRTSASAIASYDESTARMALKSLAETEELSKEVLEIIPTLAIYRSPVICRLMAAALYAIMVSAESVALVASGLILPPEKKIEPLEEIEVLNYYGRILRRSSDRREEVNCMPVAFLKRKF